MRSNRSRAHHWAWRVCLVLGIATLLGLPLVGAVSAAAVDPEPASPLHVTRTGDDLLDPFGHARSNFSGTANVSTYQQDGVITYNGWQYVAWYRDLEGSRNASAISRRQLPDGDWESVELDFDLLANDSHNNISLAVSPSDGRLHVAFGQHGQPHRYTRTAPGIADDPASVEWSSALFSPTRINLPGIEEDSQNTMTYPTFEAVPDPEGGPDKLLLTYREGSPSGGDQVLVHYNDDAEGTWTHYGSFSSGDGEYTTATGTSTGRNGYLHGFSANPATGDLEISWTWREGPGSGGCLSHDLGYASSPDLGMTWFNTAGEQIATVGTDPITIDDDHVAVPIGHDRNLINSESHWPDSAGRLHVLTSHVPEGEGVCGSRESRARPFHHWRDLDGTWHSMQIPTEVAQAAGTHWGFGRGNILTDEDDNVYVVDPGGRILVASAESGWTDWSYQFDPGFAINKETMFDRQRLAEDGVLSVVYQEQSSVTTSTRQTPAAFRIADFAFADGVDAARATEPEAPPVVFDPPPPVTEEPVPVVAASATSSSGVIAFRDPFNAFDDDFDSVWISGAMPSVESPQVLTGEFAEAHTVDEVLVAPRPHPNNRFGARDFTIEARVAGAWIPMKTVDDQPAGSTVGHTFPAVEADATRLVITDSWDTERPVVNVGVAEVQTYIAEQAPEDTTPPSTALALSPAEPDGQNAWYVTAPSFTLTADDAGSGVETTEYRVGAGEWTAYAGEPVTLGNSTDGTVEVQFRSTDASGNVEEAGSESIQLDRVAPETTATTADQGDAKQVTLAASDATSGVATTEYRVDQGAWTAYAGLISVETPGEHVVGFRSTDEAGLTEDEGTVDVVVAPEEVDETGPSVVVRGLRDGFVYGHSDRRNLRWSVSPTGSPVETVVARLDGMVVTEGHLDLERLTLGRHRLVVTATDAAGNTTEESLRFRVGTSFADVKRLVKRFADEGSMDKKVRKELMRGIDRARRVAKKRPGLAVEQLREVRRDLDQVRDASHRSLLREDVRALIQDLERDPSSRRSATRNPR